MPTRVYRLYSQVHAFHNLVWAERTAARGKRGRPDVAAFEYDLEANLLALRDALRAKTYRPGPYRHHTIREPKERLISAAPYRDRVVHHALCRVIEPYFERRFIGDSYASRLGKGTHAALDRCTELTRRYPYVLRCDIERFFPSVDHAILRDLLGRVIGDADVLWLCETILAGGIVSSPARLIQPDDAPSTSPPPPIAGCVKCRTQPSQLTLFPSGDPPSQPHISLTQPPSLTREHDALAPSPRAGGEGWGERSLPIGNQTSQFWANVYLDALDQFVKRELRCPGYVRYVDDFLLFAPDKASLHRWKAAIIAFLGERLRLRLHERESAVFPVTTGIPFLGFRVYPDHRRLRRRNAVAFARRYRALTARYEVGELTFAQLTASVQGWVAHAAHGDTYGLRRALLARGIKPPLPAEAIHARN